MSKRIAFTTVTPLPTSVPRQTAVSYLHDHLSLIDLNPLVQSRRHLMSPPPHAHPSELRCTWYALTDRLVPGLPAPISYTAAFQNLHNGVQMHAYAPMGRDVKEWWTIGGTLPGEVPETVEPGLDVPVEGLYLRQDVEVRCNVLVAGFVKKTMKKPHAALVEHIVAEAKADATKAASSSISPFHFFADDETFLGPQRQPSFIESNTERGETIDHETGADSALFISEPTTALPSPPPFLRAPGADPTPPSPTTSPSPPPAFLRPSKGTPLLKLSRAPSSFPRMRRAKASPPVAYPPPLRIPKRPSTALSSSSPADSSPDSLGTWARDSLSPHPQSSMLSRNVSVVSKYPHAAEQDYSGIAAMNPFDSDDEGSDSTVDTFFSESAGGNGFLTESPTTLIFEPVAGPPGAIPRLDLCFDFTNPFPYEI